MSWISNGKTSIITVCFRIDFNKQLFKSFSRYFYDELHQLANGLSPLRNIFLDLHTGQLQLRNNVSIHLVLSDAPNGDAKEFLPSDTNSYLNAYDAVD